MDGLVRMHRLGLSGRGVDLRSFFPPGRMYMCIYIVNVSSFVAGGVHETEETKLSV